MSEKEVNCVFIQKSHRIIWLAGRICFTLLLLVSFILIMSQITVSIINLTLVPQVCEALLGCRNKQPTGSESDRPRLHRYSPGALRLAAGRCGCHELHDGNGSHIIQPSNGTCLIQLIDTDGRCLRASGDGDEMGLLMGITAAGS